MSTDLLFDAYDRCHECGDIGFTVDGDASRWCWRAKATSAHNPPNAAARMLRRAVEHLMVRKLRIDAQHFSIASMLTRFTTDAPFDKARLLESHFTLPLRNFHYVIEDLRRIWLLPIGSRKFAPSGYWIITDEADFKSWVAIAKSAPVTQLSTIAAVAKRNFPIFAEQLELEFWNDMHGFDRPAEAVF